MRRREFIAGLGSAASWQIVARAQESVPVIGFLTSRASGDSPHLTAAVHRGLREAGFVEGHNVAIEYRFADNQDDRMPVLAADLVRRGWH